MNKREQAVLDFIDKNFEPGAVRIEDFPLFPYGKRLIDRDGGEMVVFFDLLHDQVDWTYPDVKNPAKNGRGN